MAKLPMVADGSDPKYPQHLLRLFDRTVGQTLETIEQGIGSHDLKVVQRGVHSLKSSAGQVGALAVAAEAGRIEIALRRGELDPAALQPMLQRLQAAQRRFAETVATRAPD
jgi:HPt (histidine-containing phosphotransfer) domain-containing protein